EDDARSVAVEHLAELLPVPDVRDHRDRRREAAVVDELSLDVEQSRLRLVDEDQPGRPGTRDLPAKLRADRAARARDEHGLAAQILGDRLEVHLDGPTAG